MDRLIKLALVFAIVSGMANLSGCCGGCDDNLAFVGIMGSSSSKAALVLNTALLSGSTDKIGSINVSVELPDGVTVAADSSGLIPGSALYLSGEGAAFAATPNSSAYLVGKFFPATPTAKAKVSIGFSGTNSSGQPPGMNQGEFATVICDVAQGNVFTSATPLPLSGIDIADPQGTLPHLSDTAPPTAWITYGIIL